MGLSEILNHYIFKVFWPQFYILHENQLMELGWILRSFSGKQHNKNRGTIEADEFDGVNNIYLIGCANSEFNAN